MTEIEARANGGFSNGGPRPGRALVPLVAAALVLALGLILVGLTNDRRPAHPVPPTAESGVSR